ncbi:hypothetical protein BDK51DRAFT_17426 [Blyttiomyces helicus]|uniref:Uncharacterized protein n=1 Tax=Blyttiomyces helicus TaxID=388810 RepID=A0A4P9W7H8_9FUNG|nr:hypothetical protein BDK51DRAFT_17426 [Blyttiomyces helicus]|eukprot:RKO87335.1 hypothetical protein BDK51DRAFT_17426 [Blyttiomyces helicus]
MDQEAASPPHGLTSPQPNPRTVLLLLLAGNLFTLVFTVFPVLVNLPDIRQGYYDGNDIIRLLEPLVSTPLAFALFLESGILDNALTNRGAYGAMLVSFFMFATALYGQGAGFHSAANMFKHPVKDLIDNNPTNPDVETLTDIYSWMRDTWEHIIAHYMYAVGGILQSFTYAYIFRNIDLGPDGLKSRLDRSLWIAAAVFYGLIVGGVAIEFPKGSIVALLLTIGYGAGVLGTYVWRMGGMFTWGRRLVLQYFLMAYSLGFVIVIGWIIHAKGFGNREETGMTFK